MIIKRNGQTLYGESELIKRVNKAARKSVLNRSMLAYLRDIRKLLPKPIRIKVKNGRGGAHSFYLEETVRELERMMTEYVGEGKTLKDMEPRYAERIQQLKNKTEEFRNNAYLDLRISRNFKALGIDVSPSSSLNLNRNSSGRVLYLSQRPLEGRLSHVMEIIKAGGTEEEVDRAMAELIQSYQKGKGLLPDGKGG